MFSPKIVETNVCWPSGKFDDAKRMVPLAVMGPMYDTQMPKHVKAARLGNLLARGIGHCYDPTGVKFSNTGYFTTILSNADSLTYQGVVESALSDEIIPYLEEGRTFNYEPDPTLTLNDRMSDITADYLAFNITTKEENDTTLPWVPFTSKQVYFITLAQEFCSKKTLAEMIPSIFEGHMLPNHRVGSIMMNSKQFYKAFYCPEGSKMNKYHADKIKPFPLYRREEEDHVDEEYSESF